MRMFSRNSVHLCIKIFSSRALIKAKNKKRERESWLSGD